MSKQSYLNYERAYLAYGPGLMGCGFCGEIWANGESHDCKYWDIPEKTDLQKKRYLGMLMQEDNKSMCPAGQVRNKRCEECVCYKNR